jgi:hypothetical protein
MERVLYSRTIEDNRNTGQKVVIILTEEINRLILWEEVWDGEDDEVSVLQTFKSYQKMEAIEAAVDKVIRRHKDKDSGLVQRIIHHLNAKEWNADVMDRVADEIRDAGYHILDVEEPS